VLAAAALCFAGLRLAFVSVPLERDEGEYAYIAQRLLAGDAPYRDAFDQKPPAIFLAYAAAFALLGESIEAIHGFLYAWTALTALCLHALVRRLAGGLAAAFAALVFAIASTDASLAATAANTEIFMLLPAVGALACLVRGLEAGSAARWWLACGSLSAAAAWFKPVAAPEAVFAAGFAVAAQLARGAGVRAALAAPAWMAAGALALSAPLVAWLVREQAWAAFLDAVVVHNAEYAGRHSWAQGWLALRAALAAQWPSFAVPWALAAAALALPRTCERRTRWLLGGWLLAELAGASVGLYFRRHYFVQALPALAALAGVAGAAAARRLLRLRPRALAAAGAAALVALLVAPPLAAQRRLLGAPPERISREIYGLNPFPESLTIGEYIRQTSAPDDHVYVIGSEPQIFFYARRRSATRYIYFYPLTGAYADARERQREVLREVAQRRPLYAVWAHVPTSTLMDAETDRFVFEESARLLRRDYALEFLAWLDFSQALADPALAAALEAQGFRFSYGEEARQVMQRALAAADHHIWLAVYRRAR
jgi:hypothetical protein